MEASDSPQIIRSGMGWGPIALSTTYCRQAGPRYDSLGRYRIRTRWPKHLPSLVLPGPAWSCLGIACSGSAIVDTISLRTRGMTKYTEKVR